MKNTSGSAKGFTLIELLIVIGILGVLAAAVVVVLNPAELLAQARDSSRLQDLSSINAALAFYGSAAATPTFGETAYHSQATTTADSCGGTASVAGLASTTYRDVDGTGWVDVDFTELTGGSPLSVLPIDPTNNTTYYYCYDANNTAKTWELNAVLESTKFATTEDLDGEDGGNSATTYELGTEPGLDLFS